MSLAMRTETGDRPIPFTYERAVTELVRCRRSLEVAQESLELVLEIVDQLDPDLDLPTPELGVLLGSLEVAQATLRELMTEADART